MPCDKSRNKSERQLKRELKSNFLEAMRKLLLLSLEEIEHSGAALPHDDFRQSL